MKHLSKRKQQYGYAFLELSDEFILNWLESDEEICLATYCAMPL